MHQLAQPLYQLCQRAGATLRKLYVQHLRQPLQIDIKDDASPVTCADRRANEILRQGLQQLDPGIAGFPDHSRAIGIGPERLELQGFTSGEDIDDGASRGDGFVLTRVPSDVALRPTRVTRTIWRCWPWVRLWQVMRTRPCRPLKKVMNARLMTIGATMSMRRPLRGTQQLETSNA